MNKTTWQLNYDIALRANAFNDPHIKEHNLCPICLIENGKCFCDKYLPVENPRLPWWKRVYHWVWPDGFIGGE